MLKKRDELRILLSEEKIEILYIQETWMKKRRTLKIPGYDCITNNRELRQGGGVAVLLKKAITSEIIPIRARIVEDTEVITTKICIQKQGKNVYFA